MGIDSMMTSSKDLWLVFLLVNISLLVSCKDNNLSLKEIAKVLELPIGTVKSRLNRGREFLKTALDENGKEDNHE